MKRTTLRKTVPAISTGLTALAVASALSGCALGPMQLSGTGATTTTLNLQGKAFGGNQPIVGATIQLYAVGANGYGSAATPLLTTPVTTGAGGSFNISYDYTCPGNNPLVYITATGGNPGLSGTVNNTAIKEVAALGPCGNLGISTFIFMNEVTTAATAFALGQYFTPTFGAGSTDSFGAPAATTSTQAASGLTNAFTTYNNLVTNSTGTSNTVTYAPNGSVGSVTIAPETAKLYTIADILEACVNTSSAASTNCAALFAAVTPTGGTTPTDILQAAVDMSLNPTSTNAAGSSANLTTLYGLVSATPPYPGLAAQPTDWTLGIQYTSASGFPDAQNLAVDTSGNIWITSLLAGSSNLAEMTPAGALTVNTQLPTTTCSTNTNITNLSPRNIAIDQNNNIFVTTSSSTGCAFEYTPGTAATVSFAVGKGPYGLAIDANNNVWVGASSATSTFELAEFLNGTLATTSEVQYPLVGQTAVGAGSGNTTMPEYMAFDQSGNLWFDTGAAASATVYQLSNISSASCTIFPCSQTSSSALNTYTAFTTGSPNGTFGLAAGYNPATATYSMWEANVTGNSLTNYTLAGAGTSFGTSTNFNAPHFLAVDGAGSVWAPNKGTAAITQVSAAGAILSPSGTNASGTAYTGYVHSGLTSALGVAVDQSGNVWVANNVASTGATDPNSIFELVGAAAPTYNPLTLQLKNSKIGVRP